MELLTILTIGIALSMDTFSVSLGIGTLALDNKTQFKLALIVGIFHFIMPIVGLTLGENIMYFLDLKAHILMSAILLLLAFEMLKEAFSEEKKKVNLSIMGIIIFAISVSIDSFSAGIGLGGITSHVFLSSIIFSMFSFLFTYLGLMIGKKSNKLLGKYATVIGAILLTIIAIIHFVM